MKKLDKDELVIRLLQIALVAFLVVEYSFPTALPDALQAVSNFFGFDPLAYFREGQNQEPTNFVN